MGTGSVSFKVLIMISSIALSLSAGINNVRASGENAEEVVSIDLSTQQIIKGTYEGQKVKGTIEQDVWYVESDGFEIFSPILHTYHRDERKKNKTTLEIRGVSGRPDVTVKLEGDEPQLTVGNVDTFLDDIEMEMMKKGLVPLRLVLESAGYEISYDAEKHHVIIKETEKLIKEE